MERSGMGYHIDDIHYVIFPLLFIEIPIAT